MTEREAVAYMEEKLGCRCQLVIIGGGGDLMPRGMVANSGDL